MSAKLLFEIKKKEVYSFQNEAVLGEIMNRLLLLLQNYHLTVRLKKLITSTATPILQYVLGSV